MKVLIADDDEVTRCALRGLIGYLGHDAVEARDGLEAWQMLHGAEAPGLIILDWMMPGLTGIQICEQLRSDRRRPYQYIIMLTGRDAVEDLVLGMEAGADDYLRKPCDLRELRVRIRAGERTLLEHDALRAHANTDELTHVLNRRGLMSRLEHELALVQRDGRPLSLLMLDFDRFKAINDTYGHGVGDEVLVELAKRLSTQMRGYDDLGRIGGEEFALLLPACDLVGARTVAERVGQCVRAAPIASSAGPIAVTVSIGVASVDGRSPADASGLLAAADRGMYAAKAAGRDRVETTPSQVAAPAVTT